MLLQAHWIASLLLINIQSSYGCETTGAIRLQGGGSEREGRVEICIGNQWGTTCDNQWGPEEAKVVCRQLGFTDEGAQSVNGGIFTVVSRTVHGGIYNCRGDEARLINCSRQPEGCDQRDDAGVRCNGAECRNGSLRLAGGTGSSGRVEICIEQQWGTICDDNWGYAEAAVVCRQLGFHTEGAIAVSFGAFGKATLDPIHASNFQCSGTEQQLTTCPNTKEHSCLHTEDAGVLCGAMCENGDVRVVDAEGAVSLQGYVQVCLSQTWTHVLDDSWTSSDAKVVCAQLGYSISTAIDVAQLDSVANTGSISLRNVNCTGKESKIIHCQATNTEKGSGTLQTVGVKCSQESTTNEESELSTLSSTLMTDEANTGTDISYLAWIIAGVCGGLLLTLVTVNLICLTVLAVRKFSRNSGNFTPSETPDEVLPHRPNNAGVMINMEINPSYRKVLSHNTNLLADYCNLPNTYTTADLHSYANTDFR